MFTIEHEFDATVITLVDEAEPGARPPACPVLLRVNWSSSPPEGRPVLDPVPPAWPEWPPWAFFIIVPMLAIAGSLAAKQKLNATSGTLPTHGPMFVFLQTYNIHGPFANDARFDDPDGPAERIPPAPAFKALVRAAAPAA
mgnify:CR=1 FL=1